MSSGLPRQCAHDAVHALQAKYYNQRATAGLIVSEATQISPQGKSYAGAPGSHGIALRGASAAAPIKSFNQ